MSSRPASSGFRDRERAEKDAHAGRSRLIATLWGLAEATLFFIVPDVYLSRVALADSRRAALAVLAQADLAVSCLCDANNAVNNLVATLVGGGNIPNTVELGSSLSFTSGATTPSGTLTYTWTIDGAVTNAASATTAVPC